MFLAAAPYFQIRFESDPWIYANSQSAILTTCTVVNLLSMLVLTNMQSSANYPFRIITALLINGGVFALLTLSTTTFLETSPGVYLAFILLMVAISACGTGLMQNGAFSFAASFGRPEYTQAIMAGQGVAGILPPLTQMLTFLAFSDSSPGIPEPPPDNGQPPANNEGATAAFIYFLTAVLISAATLLSFIPLVRRHTRLQTRHLPSPSSPSSPSAEDPPTTTTTHQPVPLTTLLIKIRWLAASVTMCFVATMFFPVFTTKILSVHDPSTAGRLFLPGAFIPLGFFFWNLGDLLGRVSTMCDALSLRHRPRVLFAISMARWGFLPLYLACNLHGRGAVVGGDGFYLVGVQGLFGLTNGWLGSSAMMAAGEWVEERERAAAGGLMSMCLVGGLAAWSVLSFAAAGV
jgi:equilibrative nucleoside transporter 1/2/3